MKAVIMAGGKGTRLRPLTCSRPKPMVPLLNKPVMAYALELLHRLDITEIAVTLQYLPEVIIDYFGNGEKYGVNLRYFEELKPLGTAGSVRNAEQFLDCPFLVISGDGLTDIDLQAAIDFHRRKGALATLVLTRVPNPLEYGVVMTEPDGRINRFLEKPGWSEVFSDTVNTGIYILEPEIFRFYPDMTAIDFSQDLFPLLMSQNQPLYGYIAEGYWSDIGDLEQNRQTQHDILAGKIKVEVEGEEISPGVWVGDGSVIAPGAKLWSPVFIGSGCQIENGAVVGPYTVVGDRVALLVRCSVKHSIIWHNSQIGREVELRGATVGRKVVISPKARLFEGSVVGDYGQVGVRSLVRAGAKIWPEKQVEEQAVVNESLIWGMGASKKLFGLQGISGLPNLEITPEFTARLAGATASTYTMGQKLVISSSGHNICRILKRAFAAGLLAGGLDVTDLQVTITPVTRFAVKKSAAAGGLHIRLIDNDGDQIVLFEFLDRFGINIKRSHERQIENAFAQEDFRRAGLNRIGVLEEVNNLSQVYREELLTSFPLELVRLQKFRVVTSYNAPLLEEIMGPFFDELGAEVLRLQFNSKRDEMVRIIKATGADLGVIMDHNGQEMVLFTEDGKRIEGDALLALIALVAFQRQKPRVMAVPVTAPSVIEKIAERWQGRVVRTKTNPRALMEVNEGDTFQPLYEAPFALGQILAYLAEHRARLTALLALVPAFHLREKVVPCAWRDKGKIMRRLVEESNGRAVELTDGIKFHLGDGWTMVLPDADKPLFRVLSEAGTMEAAEELVSDLALKISELANA